MNMAPLVPFPNVLDSLQHSGGRHHKYYVRFACVARNKTLELRAAAARIYRMSPSILCGVGVQGWASSSCYPEARRTYCHGCSQCALLLSGSF